MLHAADAFRQRDPRERVVVALDVDDAVAALRLTEVLAPQLRWVKVGLELFTAAGPEIVRSLTASGLQVFLDLKLHDIPHTVERAAAAAGTLGVRLCTVHALGGPAIDAAVRGFRTAAGEGDRRAGGPFGILAVTVLTSHAEGDLQGLVGSAWTTSRLTAHLAARAIAAGAAGLVCSPREVAALRTECGERSLLVVPGVRPAGSPADDQQRTGTPAATLRAGADLLVVGRPITRAPDPHAAFGRLLDEIGTAV